MIPHPFFRHQILSVLALAACLLVFLQSQPAMAHSREPVSQPADGAVLTVSPGTISLQFDKPMRITLVTLTNGDGGTHELSRTDGMKPVTAFEAGVTQDLPAGHYRLEWRGLSSDGHPMVGGFSFDVAR